MKIMFVSEKSLDECNPELVEKLLNTNSFSDVCNVDYEFDYDYEELVDTMFAITREKRIKNRILNDKANPVQIPLHALHLCKGLVPEDLPLL